MITGQKFEVPRDLENINQRIVKKCYRLLKYGEASEYSSSRIRK